VVRRGVGRLYRWASLTWACVDVFCVLSCLGLTGVCVLCVVLGRQGVSELWAGAAPPLPSSPAAATAAAAAAACVIVC